MKTELDLNTWNRKEHYRFFKDFEEPFFGMTARINCTNAYHHSKGEGHSFYLSYLHAILQAVHQLKAFRYRMEEDKVFLYSQINASCTVDRPDGTFGFSRIHYKPEFREFAASARQVIDEVRGSTGLAPSDGAENVIHFSAVPWVDFTAISHARPFSRPDSSPKIAVGKMTSDHGQLTMPVSVHVHHALVDGKNVGEFYEILQERMNVKI